MPCEDRDAQGEDHPVMMEAEAEVLQLQTKEHLGLPESERGKERSSSRGIRGSMALLTP